MNCKKKKTNVLLGSSKLKVNQNSKPNFINNS